MFIFPERYRVPFDGNFDRRNAATAPPDDKPDKKTLEQLLKEQVKRFDELQQLLYAHNQYALLLVFQAIDAAGKDGTIRAVTRGVNPVGFQVHSFKQPSAQELEHDFLWRTTNALPERGRVGVFNRSYYEEVLVVRVHPEYLAGQHLPSGVDHATLWADRFVSIRQHEQHLARNGTVILKFWLNVSKDEQKQRFLKRLDEPEKNWKFSAADVQERQHWDTYMHAYGEALAETSRDYAPWYAIPADNKAYMRLMVAETIVQTLEKLPMQYPEPDEKSRSRFAEARRLLEGEGESA